MTTRGVLLAAARVQHRVLSTPTSATTGAGSRRGPRWRETASNAVLADVRRVVIDDPEPAQNMCWTTSPPRPGQPREIFAAAARPLWCSGASSPRHIHADAP